MKSNVAANVRVVITTDHGFAELADDGALPVTAAASDDRNLPRVLPGARDLGRDGLVVSDGTTHVTVATSRRWFSSEGSRRWRFAHGGCTLHEVLVPFAELSPIREGAVEVAINGLPEKLEIEEGQHATLEFTVRVSGEQTCSPL